jgi:hypothetical protein
VESLEEEIIAQYKETGEQWEDPEFVADSPSLYRTADVVPEYDREAGCTKWVRPDEISHKPVLFANGISPGDV